MWWKMGRNPNSDFRVRNIASRFGEHRIGLPEGLFIPLSLVGAQAIDTGMGALRGAGSAPFQVCGVAGLWVLLH